MTDVPQNRLPGTDAPPSRGLRARRSLGFTLIELLVVIAIIAILVTMLFPLGKSMLDRANAAKCVSNQRQIFSGMMLWIQNNDGYLPFYIKSVGSGGAFYWYAEMSRNDNTPGGPTLPYCPHNPLRVGESKKSIWICPANDPYRRTTGTARDNSYAISQAIYPNSSTNSTPVKLISLAKPSRTVAIGEWNLDGTTVNEITQYSDIATPHGGGCNLMFFDGHVEFMKPAPAYTNGIFKRTGGD